MKSKIEITLTEKEASHLRTLLEGGVTITDSITQSEVFYGILSKLNSQLQPEEEKEKEVPIMQVTDGGFTYWVADTHIEEYPEEPTQDITEDKWLKVKEAIENLAKEDLFTWLQDVLVFPEWEVDEQLELSKLNK